MNPPYIERAALPNLMPEVARFEPRTALDGGADGLDEYRRLMPHLPRLLAENGLAALEIGAGGAAAVVRLAEAAGLAVREARPDLAGSPRALALGLHPKNRLAAEDKAASLRGQQESPRSGGSRELRPG